jgi:hypothetical protein
MVIRPLKFDVVEKFEVEKVECVKDSVCVSTLEAVMLVATSVFVSIVSVLSIFEDWMISFAIKLLVSIVPVLIKSED